MKTLEDGSAAQAYTIAPLDTASELLWQTLVADAFVQRCWHVVEDPTRAHVRLRVEGEAALLYDADGVLLARIAATAEAVAHRLRLLAHAWTVARLPHAPHAPAHAEPLDVLLTDADGAPLPRHDDHAWVLTAGERVHVRIANQTPHTLFVVLLNIGADGTCTPLHPPDTPFRLAGGEVLTLGEEGTLRATLPADGAETRDTLKVLAFSAPVVLPKWLGGVHGGGEPRAFWQALREACVSPNIPPDAPWWYAATVRLVTIRPPETTAALDVQTFDIRVEIPPGFGGEVRAFTQGQHLRAFDVPAPPGLQGVAEPVALVHRSQRAAPAVALEIAGTPEDFAAVRAETPLMIGLPTTRDMESQGVVALAHDGEFFYPVGRREYDGMVRITWLPPGGEASIGVRDWRRTVRLYFYRLTGWGKDPLTDGTLHVAWYVPPHFSSGHPGFDVHVLPTDDGGAVHYRSVHATDLQPGMRIALIVHGFNSDSRHFVRALSQFPEKGICRAYDRVLTFDYESVGTGVWENAERLGKALRSVLDGRGVQVDMFAHSMGTAISRLAIEREGGAPYVRRLFLAATPNEGTLLAKAKDAATLLATILINRSVPQPQAFLLGWALGRLAETLQGIESLEPDSEVVAQLLQPVDNPRIPYFVMAGNAVPEELSERRRLERLYRVAAHAVDTLLDHFFADQHDLILNMRSMCALGNRGLYPAALLDQRTLTCDHFHYFADADALAIWRDWLS